MYLTETHRKHVDLLTHSRLSDGGRSCRKAGPHHPSPSLESGVSQCSSPLGYVYYDTLTCPVKDTLKFIIETSRLLPQFLHCFEGNRKVMKMEREHESKQQGMYVLDTGRDSMPPERETTTLYSLQNLVPCCRPFANFSLTSWTPAVALWERLAKCALRTLSWPPHCPRHGA